MVAPLNTILKITGSFIASTPRMNGNKVVGGGDAIGGDTINGGAISQSDASRKSAKSKSRTKSGYLGNSNDLEEPKLLTSKAKEAFNRLRQAFIEASIL